MRISFLFWNLNKQPRHDRIARMVRHYSVDVVILAECATSPDIIREALNQTDCGPYSFPFAASDKVRIFSRLPEDSVVAQSDDSVSRITIRRVLIDPLPEFLLVAVHLRSRVNWSERDQAQEATRLSREITRVEDKVGHQRTVVVGDFNMNPFDDGIVSSHGFHAVMSREQARRGSRRVDGESYSYFYNPMWSCFGDRSAGPPGTYYLRSSKPVNYFWNMYDQVLLRPELMNNLGELRIVDAVGTERYVTKRGLPKKSVGSDHLPLLFRLEF